MKGIAEPEKTILALPVEQRMLLAYSLLNSLPEAWSKAKEMVAAEFCFCP